MLQRASPISSWVGGRLSSTSEMASRQTSPTSSSTSTQPATSRCSGTANGSAPDTTSTSRSIRTASPTCQKSLAHTRRPGASLRFTAAAGTCWRSAKPASTRDAQRASHRLAGAGGPTFRSADSATTTHASPLGFVRAITIDSRMLVRKREIRPWDRCLSGENRTQHARHPPSAAERRPLDIGPYVTRDNPVPIPGVQGRMGISPPRQTRQWREDLPVRSVVLRRHQ